MTESIFFEATLVAAAISTMTFFYALASNPVPPAPTLGVIGLKRAQALATNKGFRRIEPAIRVVAGWLGVLPLRGMRQRWEKALVAGGHWMGLLPDELGAVCVLCFGVGLCLGAALTSVANATPILALLIGAVGAVLPTVSVSNYGQERQRRIERDLPTAIDLIALCMSAGLDFPGALRLIIRNGAGRSPLDEELSMVLKDVDLGHPRRHALAGLAARVPTETVSQFVSAVVQSEEKGNPLAEVLVIQGTVLRQRRTVMAEEAASKAGVQMSAPLAVLIIATLIIIAGPLMLRMTTEMGKFF